MESSRRNFILQTGKLLLLTGSAAAAWPRILAGEPEKADNYQMTNHWWGMIIDLDECIGCGNCVRADKLENHVPMDPRYFRTWVERYHIRPIGPEHPQTEELPEVDSENGGMDGFPEKYNQEDGSKNFFVPKLCNHCSHSPCTQVCPVGATFESPDGVVLVDRKYCLGCRYCVQACPYGCRYIHPELNVVDKCTLCYHRITRGLKPACCEACPTGARKLVDFKDPKDMVHEYLKNHMVHVLKPHMATGAKVYYHDLDGQVR
jgi:Fe-S-cluster-containing dehydrogenase component